MRAIVVDDEPLARQRLARMLEAKGWEVVGIHREVAELLHALQEGLSADVLFLDVEMPGANGIEALAEMERAMPVVFVTAFPQHAARAYDLDALDYLVKPVFQSRLDRALEKVQRHLHATSPAPTEAPLKPPPTRFPAKAAGGVFFLDPRKVTYFEYEDFAVWAWMGGERFRGPWESLSMVEEAFPKVAFLRIQRHLLIRPESILSLRGLPGGRVVVRIADGPELEVSRSMTPKVRELLGLRRSSEA